MWQRGLTPESVQSGEGRGSSPGEMRICLVNNWYVYTICSIRLPLSLKHTEVIQSRTRSLSSLAKLFKEKFQVCGYFHLVTQSVNIKKLSDMFILFKLYILLKISRHLKYCIIHVYRGIRGSLCKFTYLPFNYL